MLVLSRKKNEQIVIGDNVVITIVDVRGDKVRIGIQAPPEVPVHRHEIYLALQQATEATPSPSNEPTSEG
ncbi:MAG: carbon storage regulator CsrA [Pirellulaceae bacterium]